MDTKKLRQKILDLAIRGKLVPQDPNDEPASVLLERVRAEKERLIKEGKIKRSKKIESAASEIEAPFEIPKSWEWVRLEDFVMAVTDGDHQPPPQSATGVPFLVISDVNTGFIDFSHARFVSNEYYNSLPAIRQVTKGDILFTVTGSYGIPILVETDQKFCFQRHIGLIKTIECSGWISTVLRSNYVLNYCDKVATGTAQKTVSLGHLRDLPIPVPFFAEQQRIANEVERWFTLIDELESNEGDLLKAIDQAKSKILDLAVHGKLVPQDPNDEPALALLERIRAEKKQLEKAGKFKKIDLKEKPISEEEIPFEIPDSWEWCRLKTIASKIVDGDHNPPHGLDSDSGYYMLSSKNINNDSVRLFDDVRFLSYEDWKKCHERTSLMKGDVLLTTVATLGRSCVYEDDIPYCFQRSVSIVRTCVFNYFVKYCFDSPYYQTLIDDKAIGTAQRGFYLNQLEESVIPLPPLAEQKRIVAKIEELFAVLDSIKASLD